MVKKLAIVCGSPSSEMAAPFDDPDYEVWVLGNRINRYPRYDLIFEIHDDLSEHGDPIAYAKMLVAKNVPMIVGEGFPVDASHVEVFDFDASRELFGSTYLTSSTAYMMSEALCRGFEHIELYGADMAVNDHEYFWQRPCLEAWVGFAKGRGVNVVIPACSPVGKSDYVEGEGAGGRPDFSKPPFTQAGFAKMAQVHQEKVAAAKAEIAQLQKIVDGHDGAAQVYDQLMRVARAVEAGNDIQKLEDAFQLR